MGCPVTGALGSVPVPRTRSDAVQSAAAATRCPYTSVQFDVTESVYATYTTATPATFRSIRTGTKIIVNTGTFKAAHSISLLKVLLKVEITDSRF